jgi:thioester reductase-like protein
VSTGVLITGFPNVSSRLLLRRLLGQETTAGPVFLLTVSSAEAEAQRFIAQLDPTLARKVVLIVGRLSAIDLGLSGTEYKQLANHVAVIHHCAATVSPSLDKAAAEEINIAATREILEFARMATEFDRLIFYSSVLTLGIHEDVGEEAPVPPGVHFDCAAQRALAGAEQMVLAAMERVPSVLVRAGLLACDSRNGDADADSPLSSLILLLARARRDWPVFMPGTGQVALPIVPVDYLVDVALRIARRNDSLDKIFHVLDPHPPKVAQIFQWVRGESAPTRNMPLGLGRALFNVPGPLSWANTPRMLMNLMTTPARYDTANTVAVLADAGLICPHFEDYVARYAQNLLGKSPRRQQAGTIGA